MESEIACCADLLSFLYELNITDIQVFYSLDQGVWKTKESICKSLKKEQSTVNRSLQKLVSRNLVLRDVRQLKDGGYLYVYSLQTTERIVKETNNRINNLYEKMLSLSETLKKELEVKFSGIEEK